MGDLRRSIDQHDTAASPFVAPQSMADKRLLPGGNISDFIQFTIGKKHEFNGKISRSVVIYPPDEVQQTHTARTSTWSVFGACPARK